MEQHKILSASGKKNINFGCCVLLVDIKAYTKDPLYWDTIADPKQTLQAQIRLLQGAVWSGSALFAFVPAAILNNDSW